MTFEVFVMIVMALLATAIFMLYRMAKTDQQYYVAAIDSLNAALNSCIDAIEDNGHTIDSYGNIIESVVIPLKKKLDADSTTPDDHEGDTDGSSKV